LRRIALRRTLSFDVLTLVLRGEAEERGGDGASD
jgi:hypothetical protein